MQLLAIVVLAASPRFHEAVHSDAGQRGHECGVTLFAHGKCDSAPAPAIFTTVWPVEVGDLAPTNTPSVSISDHANGILEHAPPADS